MKAEKKTIIARICSVVINLIFAVAGFFGTLFGLIVLDPYPFQLFREDYGEPEVYGYDFLGGLFLIVVSVVVPIAVNFLLHRFWYSKCGLSKKWIYIPMAIITVGLLGFAVYMIIYCEFIDGWVKGTWYW